MSVKCGNLFSTTLKFNMQKQISVDIPMVLHQYLTCITLVLALILLPSYPHVYASTLKPRDHSMTSDSKLNRLAQEKSPYLLQHATNPVDWYPWSEEAFEKARQEDKPVFLSIGYSTCHWCHVMEHESFEDQQIANYLNEHFVAVKVDREERPDIDTIYMSAVQTMTGHGGWPLSVFLTPDKKPFFGGTYFPPFQRWGTPGFTDILHSIQNAWTNNRTQLIESSNSLSTMLAERQAGQEPGEVLGAPILEKAFNLFLRSYDKTYGGFGEAPKFPTSHNLSFLLRYWNRTADAQALSMVEGTLRQMADGGMYDQLGGGFHRYSTDREWQVPHFEKMLYDQAILARTYLEAYQITKNDFYADIARDIFKYCMRDLRDSRGAFHSAEDADSVDPYEFEGMSVDPEGVEKKEGAFFLWTHKHLVEVLGESDAKVFGLYYGVKPNGNAKSDPHGEFTGKNILHVDQTVQQVAETTGKTESEVREVLENSRKQLFEIRRTRLRPHLDDKVLTDWNGLMISSLAFGGRVLNETSYLEAAEEAAQFILHNMMQNGRLLHRYRDGESGIAGTLEDYAFFANGLLDLYEATFDVTYIEKAVELTDQMLKYFWDDERGGFYLTASDAEQLIMRPKEIYDGAIPSGNSVAALVLIRLYHMTFQPEYQQRLEVLGRAFSDTVRQYPSAYAQFLLAIDFAVGPAQEIVIAGSSSDAGIRKITDKIFSKFLPNRVLIHRGLESEDNSKIFEIAPFVAKQPPIADKPTVYVCENHQCKQPTNDLKTFVQILEDI